LSCFSYSESAEIRRCFIAIAFQLCFRKYHQESAGRQGMVLDETYQLLGYADFVSMLIWGEGINTKKKSTKTQLDTRWQIGLKINTEKTKYMIVSRHQNWDKIPV
jgi:hypothetical protein